MANDKPEPGAGDVPITLDGEELSLVPTLEACRQISKLAGDSLAQAIARINRLDFEFVVEIVALGLNATSPQLKKEVAEKIYKQGLISVAADCILYVRTIMNGGRRPDLEEAGDDAEDPLAAAESGSPLENSTAS
jgi:hypothetical protein